jgi:phytoene dehydrogenase-like protein
MKNVDAVVIGTGMGSLTTACLLTKRGLSCTVLEQNSLAGGCTSSYWRKGFVFESGATTLVGLDEGMPLHRLVGELGIDLKPTRLEVPMQVHLKNGQTLTRHQDLQAWIAEAENAFGKKNQRAFWEFCYKLSGFVWRTSLKQTAFPPTRLRDLWHCALNANAEQLYYAQYAFYTVDWLLKRYDLHENTLFVDFVNEQLLITAQNYAPEVNLLFGATALCYTNYGNYYMEGGLINLVNPFLAYLQARGAEVNMREAVQHITHTAGKYIITTNKDQYSTKYLIAGIPINNLVEIYAGKYQRYWQKKILTSESLNSAFQMGIAFRGKNENPCLHYQIHLEKPLPAVESASIFVSLNHPNDQTRSDEAGYTVASVSTHLHHPEQRVIADKTVIENCIIGVLEARRLLKREDIVYTHSSAQKSWAKWTGRKYGFVGGYPQMKRIKPWQMPATRIDGKGAYLCGDTAYPGQGIPGVVLSGIIAYKQLERDFL